MIRDAMVPRSFTNRAVRNCSRFGGSNPETWQNLRGFDHEPLKPFAISHQPSAMTRLTSAVLILALPVLAGAQAQSDRDVLARIRVEGLERSQAGAVFDMLTVTIGPRLTASPAHKRAAEWARDRLTSQGLANARLEPWKFGRGWTLEKLTVEMVEPRYLPLIGYADGWSPSTNGEIVAAPVFIGGKSPDEVADDARAAQGRDRDDAADDDELRRGEIGRSRAIPPMCRTPRRTRPSVGRPAAAVRAPAGETPARARAPHPPRERRRRHPQAQRRRARHRLRDRRATAGRARCRRSR